jgi:hypothetical protein
MRVGLFRLVCVLAVLGVAVTARAQYGHPLKGTWSGDWGVSKDSRNRVLLELNWDGKLITGTINPGPNAVPLQKASLDPATWTVRLEAAGKDRSGNTVRYVIEGKLENLGSYYRVLTGTWSQGTMKGDFRLTRN